MREALEEKIQLYFGLLNAHLKEKRQNWEGKTPEKLIKGLVLLAENFKSKLDKLTQYVTDHSKDLYTISYAGGVKARVYALKLVFSVEGSRGNVPSDRFFRCLYDLEFSIGLMESTVLDKFFTILLKAVKCDTNTKRVSAMVKRMLQQCMIAPVNYVIGGLLVLARAIQTHPAIAASLLAPAYSTVGGDNSEDDEEFKDMPDSDAEPEEPAKKDAKPKEKESAPAKVSGYDWRKRDPQYANADKSCLWEIVGLAQHYHPLVAQWSKEILAQGPKVSLKYDGQNPLLDFKVVNMLDRMTYKDPKKKVGRSAPRSANFETPFTSYWRDMQGKAEEKKAASVKPHEQFLAKYFENRDKRTAGKKKPSGPVDEKKALEEAADEIIQNEMKRMTGLGKEDDDEIPEGLDLEPEADKAAEPEEDEASSGSDEPFSDLEDEGSKWAKEDEKDPGMRGKRGKKFQRKSRGKFAGKSGDGKQAHGGSGPAGFRPKRRKIQH